MFLSYNFSSSSPEINKEGDGTTDMGTNETRPSIALAQENNVDDYRTSTQKDGVTASSAEQTHIMRKKDCPANKIVDKARFPKATSKDKVNKKKRTYLVGGSRARDIFLFMKRQGYTEINTSYKSGSTINWARGEIRNKENGATIILQTGVNNILNTKQSNANIIHQFKELLKENEDKKIYITSEQTDEKLWLT